MNRHAKPKRKNTQKVRKQLPPSWRLALVFTVIALFCIGVATLIIFFPRPYRPFYNVSTFIVAALTAVFTSYCAVVEWVRVLRAAAQRR